MTDITKAHAVCCDGPDCCPDCGCPECGCGTGCC
jgi:hypothetical protein